MTSRQDNPTSPSGGGEEPLVIVRVERPGKRLETLADELDLYSHQAAEALGFDDARTFIRLCNGWYTCDWAAAEARLRAYAAARKETP